MKMGLKMMQNVSKMMRFDEIPQISTNPRLKCDENDEMMMMFYKI